MLVVFENKKNALFVVEAVDFEGSSRNFVAGWRVP
jgi:hypothetical protein